jgi:hypothetical protein
MGISLLSICTFLDPIDQNVYLLYNGGPNFSYFTIVIVLNFQSDYLLNHWTYINMGVHNFYYWQKLFRPTVREIDSKPLRLGVLICLDVISIKISISTPKKYQSRQSRKYRQFQKVSLDDREISVEIEISRFCLDEVSQACTF